MKSDLYVIFGSPYPFFVFRLKLHSQKVAILSRGKSENSLLKFFEKECLLEKFNYYQNKFKLGELQLK